jgi:hypothetical protein
VGHPEIDLSATGWLVASFAVWRLTHLLSAEDGPWDAAARLRARLGQGAIGRMVACFYCLSVWVALPFVPWLTDRLATGLVVWAGLSGAAIVIERLTDRSPPVAAWHEEDPP